MDKNEDKSATSPNESDFKVSVSAKALSEVLTALTGSAHTVHELRITRGLIGYNNPIDQLIDEFNTETKKHLSPTTDPDTLDN
jgi:hypothetical protein